MKLEDAYKVLDIIEKHASVSEDVLKKLSAKITGYAYDKEVGQIRMREEKEKKIRRRLSHWLDDTISTWSDSWCDHMTTGTLNEYVDEILEIVYGLRE